MNRDKPDVRYEIVMTCIGLFCMHGGMRGEGINKNGTKHKEKTHDSDFQ